VIFLDANYFLRYLVQPDSLDNRTKHEIAAALFEAIERGDEEATTSGAVLAEVAFVLASKRQYDLPASDIAAYLASILRLQGLKLPRGRKLLYLRATDIWASRPKLGFVDALTAATVENSNLRLATFDSDFDGMPNIRRWSNSTES
jgi:predicted nucleic acid-binding protein